jgi:hypothetical protein
MDRNPQTLYRFPEFDAGVNFLFHGIGMPFHLHGTNLKPIDFLGLFSRKEQGDRKLFHFERTFN